MSYKMKGRTYMAGRIDLPVPLENNIEVFLCAKGHTTGCASRIHVDCQI